METKTLVLVFLDTEGNKRTYTIQDPKEDLTKTQVDTAMQAIINGNTLRGNSGNSLDGISQAYYRTVTTTQLTDPAEE